MVDVLLLRGERRFWTKARNAVPSKVKAAPRRAWAVSGLGKAES